MTRASICDVPGCGAVRRRRHRLCDRCFAKLPGEIRVAISEGHHQRRWPAWRDACRRAADFLNLSRAAPARPATSPQRAYELQARLLGERTDV